MLVSTPSLSSSTFVFFTMRVFSFPSASVYFSSSSYSTSFSFQPRAASARSRAMSRTMASAFCSTCIRCRSVSGSVGSSSDSIICSRSAGVGFFSVRFVRVSNTSTPLAFFPIETSSVSCTISTFASFPFITFHARISRCMCSPSSFISCSLTSKSWVPASIFVCGTVAGGANSGGTGGSALTYSSSSSGVNGNPPKSHRPVSGS